MSRGAALRWRWAKALALGLGLGTLGFAIWSVEVMLPRATGYAAKVACTATFVTGRSPEQIADEELAGVGFVSLTIDHSRGEVRASVLGLAEQRARHLGWHGCMLIGPEDPANSEMVVARSAPVDPRAWPLGEGDDLRPDPGGLERGGLDQVVAAAFAEPDLDQPRRTRAVVVAWQGRLLAERYADGFERDTPLPGWSMAKSLTNAMVGLLVREGELELGEPAPIAEWAGDPRGAITLDHLLRMSSGLQFSERYGPFGEGSDMLFVDDDVATRAIAKPLIGEPGQVFAYSSASANIVARVIGDCFTDADTQREFVERELFEPLAIRTAVLELDRAGKFIGSSFASMSARDWTRLGQLYLDEGVWQGQAILPEGWVEYTRTPAPACRQGEYGALFQTNVGQVRLPSVPADAFEMVGHEGQSVLIVPSRQAVIVRLGLTQGATWDTDGFAAEVLATLPP